MERCRLSAFSAPAGEPLLPTTEGLPTESSFAHAASAGARSAATLWGLASGICKSVSPFARHTNKPSGSIGDSMSDALLAVKAAHATVVFSQLPSAAATSNTHPKFQRRSPNLGGDCRQADASVYEVCHREGRSAFAPRLPGAPIGREGPSWVGLCSSRAVGGGINTGSEHGCWKTTSCAWLGTTISDWILGPLRCTLPTFVQRHTVCVWRTPSCLGLQAPLRVSISRWICAAANCLRSAALLARLNHSPLCPNPTALLRLPDP